eukprot:CAMPEP_0114596238 /NCGR_PEP_ID=MMETSP0125-20121206/18217_1 /TAXON_ID=485358 ORGANISM="Aristerostoma sp., Strain ATCC 50986" /NCGR_SAMPLE_ID=MMETSP0125 /ASSEMBLY_ACC=CAM_ASM_000245 /LENGTH=69 /DNA_ID=CAMNT_0001798987 /DNA_START=283 /DNA_END=489 /DNA_ORIENTATION=-
MEHVGGYFLLLDFTQCKIGEGRKRGESWCLFKNGEGMMPVSDFIEKDKIKDPHNLNLELKVNGDVKQAA